MEGFFWYMDLFFLHKKCVHVCQVQKNIWVKCDSPKMALRAGIAALIGMTERRAIHQGRDLPASVMIIRIIQRVQLAKIQKFMSLSV